MGVGRPVGAAFIRKGQRNMSSQASGGLASYLLLIIIVAAFWLLVLRG